MSITPYNPPQDDIEIVHADHEILVVNKPSGLLSVPGKGPELADCLITRLQAIYPEVLLVHRLDRDTSGAMVFGLTPHAQRHLGKQFEKRTTKKTYVARVHGQVEHKTGTVDQPIGVDWPNRPLQMIDYENGRAAQTDWRVMKSNEIESRLRLFPKTGRSHQLRVHTKFIGHPILGDPLYTPDTYQDYPRMMLHAEELRISHPDGGKGHTFRVKAPF